MRSIIGLLFCTLITLQTKEYLKVPLYGNQSTGYYDLYLKVGGQMQRFNVDTGSHILVVNTVNCKSCNKAEFPSYDERTSSSNEYFRCVSLRIVRPIHFYAVITNAPQKKPMRSAVRMSPMVSPRRPHNQELAIFRATSFIFSKKTWRMKRLKALRPVFWVWQIQQNLMVSTIRDPKMELWD